MSKNDQTVLLEIARAVIEIRGLDWRLASALSKKYETFVSSKQATLRAQIDWQDIPENLANVDPVWSGSLERLEMSWPMAGRATRVQGWYAASAEYGQLTIAAFDPRPAIELFLRGLVAIHCHTQGGVYLHGAGVIDHQSSGRVFFGPSGAGKTTAARLSSPRKILNDDLLCLIPDDDAWTLYSTPFRNPTQNPASPGQARLKGLYRLVQAKTAALRPMSGSDAFAELLASVPILPGLPGAAMMVMPHVDSLLNSAPAYWLDFALDNTFWSLLES